MANEEAKNKAPAGKSHGGKAPIGNKPKKAKAGDAPVDTGPKTPSRLKTRYDSEVAKSLEEAFGIKNAMERPRLRAIVINVNLGRHLEGTKLPPVVRQTALDTLTKITGQKPVVIKAKKSVSNFKVRAGYETAAMVTLRRDRMWHFLDRLVNLATPRIKDFRGLNDKAFDGQGNYSMGLTEQGVFPEINMAEVTFTHGMNINFIFSNSTPEMSKHVLTQLGMPFRKEEKREKAA